MNNALRVAMDGGVVVLEVVPWGGSLTLITVRGRDWSPEWSMSWIWWATGLRDLLRSAVNPRS